MRRGLLCLLFAVWFAVCAAVTISNVVPRLDVDGNIVNAHDGCIMKFGDTFFLYGTVYENCNQPGPICNGICGYLNNTFALYTSPDMVTWTLQTTNVLPDLDKNNAKVSYWMPNVAYNNKTQIYSMVYWSGLYGFVNNMVAIATSSSPYGPFVNQNPIQMFGAKVISSTMNLYVDPDDGTAYIRYNTRDLPYRHVVESLTPDWAESSGSYATIFVKNDYPWYEGGGLFKKDNMFYTMIGTDCCFCQWGGDALVFTATNPLVNWTLVSESNFCADGNMPAQHNISMQTNPCDLTNYQGTNYTIPAQQFNVVTVPSAAGPTYLFYGERFRSSPDGIKAHDFQAWVPINFTEDGAIQKMQWVDQFELNI